MVAATVDVVVVVEATVTVTTPLVTEPVTLYPVAVGVPVHCDTYVPAGLLVVYVVEHVKPEMTDAVSFPTKPVTTGVMVGTAAPTVTEGLDAAIVIDFGDMVNVTVSDVVFEYVPSKSSVERTLHVCFPMVNTAPLRVQSPETMVWVTSPAPAEAVA